MPDILFRKSDSEEYKVLEIMENHIKLKDLKGHLVKKLQCVPSKTVLKVFNADTSREYLNPKENIPANTKVVIERKIKSFELPPREATKLPVEVERLQPCADVCVDGKKFECHARDLEVLALLGRGAYGVVEKMRHRTSGAVMAVKRQPVRTDTENDNSTIRELDVAMRASDCLYTVHFYGALHYNGDIWLCMEVMDAPLDSLYEKVFKNENTMPEELLGVIACSMIRGLHYLSSKLQVMHRDVKPSNVLVNRAGRIKLCDFGISGVLEDSVAKTQNKGCKPYMAPERILGNTKAFDVTSDVWSFGISMIEIATGSHPYTILDTPFKQLDAICKDASPRLPGSFSPAFQDVINVCLRKEHEQRPKYEQLLQHDFFQTHTDSDFDVAGFVHDFLPPLEIYR